MSHEASIDILSIPCTVKPRQGRMQSGGTCGSALCSNTHKSQKRTGNSIGTLPPYTILETPGSAPTAQLHSRPTLLPTLRSSPPERISLRQARLVIRNEKALTSEHRSEVFAGRACRHLSAGSVLVAGIHSHVLNIVHIKSYVFYSVMFYLLQSLLFTKSSIQQIQLLQL